MLQQNPYVAEPGPALDRFIHERVMKESNTAGACPAYSGDEKSARKVLSTLRALGKGSIIVGRTDLEGRTWFARYETDAMNGTEVFADTFALAVCRMALLRM